MAEVRTPPPAMHFGYSSTDRPLYTPCGKEKDLVLVTWYRDCVTCLDCLDEMRQEVTR